ncbi:MAG: TetR/AcrR family transcriptional regulator C-terminal domain-containing protein [Rhizobiales bacterium]|nr:TetR/AcrR family transcriptional regulator C-terminal domain-containing protein [Hyphomicrobiales bacterium]
MIAKRSSSRNKQRQPEQESCLSRERIASAAVELLDEKGVAGLTMRQLADRLGSGVMSLYWHVNNKENVFDLALDSVFEYSNPPEMAEAQDWREEIFHVLEDWRAVMLRHPWSASLLPRRTLGQNILNRLELLSATLSSVGVKDADLNVAIWTLWNYVMGATVTRASFTFVATDRAESQPRVEPISGRNPTIERTRLLLDDDWDGVFRKGLGILLEGLAPRQP